MKERLPPDWSRMGRAVGLLIVIAFASAILWSIWSETLLPLMRKGDLRGLSLNMTGIPLVLLGVGLLVYGGIQFVNRTAVALGDETFRERASFVRSDPRPEARWEVWKLNLRQLGSLWWPALILLALAFILIITGGMLINM